MQEFHRQPEADPAIVSELIQQSEDALDLLKQQIRPLSGAALFAFIREDIAKMKQGNLFGSQNMQAILTGMNARNRVNEKMYEWLGEKNAADTLLQSVPGNITSQMGLELLDLADAVRPYPEVITFLQQTKKDDLMAELPSLNGGRQVREAISAYLEKYGMRCAGEIDITRSRWAEKPSTLIPLILGNIKNFAPGEAARRFEQGRQESEQKERELLNRLEQLPDGKEKAAETQRQIRLLRSFAGYREYPKYNIVSRFFVYKKALLHEAEKLFRAGVIREKEDVFYLRFEEFCQAVETQTVDPELIQRRKEEQSIYEKRSPPRLITSEGECISGAYLKGDLPAGALAGLAVSSGITEGRARVLLHMENAKLEKGDILVTTFTDPGWTPLFVSVKGLVTEVGGLMTHGAVIAREYGLAAVVGVENATTLIKDGQRIRVNGTEGYVEIL
ncbi:MAG: phosphoenolpyruvate synthase [Bacteroidia bacterium]|nr:phosphoenolpyruvate synthase [Bacteroidia bacterium]